MRWLRPSAPQRGPGLEGGKEIWGAPRRAGGAGRPPGDFYFLVEFDLPLPLAGSSTNPSFWVALLWSCVHQTSRHRTCPRQGVAAPRSLRGTCLPLWSPPALLLLKKKPKLLFSQLQQACIPTENPILGYFGPPRRMPLA